VSRVAELLALIAPPLCLVCRAPVGGPAELLCVACSRGLPWLRGWRCPRCALPRHRGGGCPAARASFAAAHAAMAYEGGARALVQLSSPLFDFPFAKRIVDFTAKHRLPAISMFRRVTERGGLMSYGPNPEYYKRLAVYIDRILKGAKPGDLPIEQPTKFDLIINLKTAKALGLALPPSLVSRADQVIR